MPFEREIDQFLGFIERQVSAADQLAEGVHCKILLCCLLDTLSRARYGRGVPNQERLTGLVEEHTTWPAWHSISLPQLAYLLRRDPTGRNSPSLRTVDADVRSWETSTLRYARNDPTLAEVAAMVSVENHAKALKQAMHVYLFGSVTTNG